MREQYFRQLLDRRPFERLRVHVSTGSYYDIPHPEFAQSGNEALVLTISGDAAEKVKYVHCSWLHVSHVEVMKLTR